MHLLFLTPFQVAHSLFWGIFGDRLSVHCTQGGGDGGSRGGDGGVDGGDEGGENEDSHLMQARETQHPPRLQLLLSHFFLHCFLQEAFAHVSLHCLLQSL